MSFKVGLATLSDHKAAERRIKEVKPKLETKTFYVVNVPVSSETNGLYAENPYFLPTFETREAAQDFRSEGGLEGYSITELVLERRIPPHRRCASCRGTGRFSDEVPDAPCCACDGSGRNDD